MKIRHAAVALLLLPIIITVFTSCKAITNGAPPSEISSGLSSEYYLKSLIVNAPSLYVEGDPNSSKLDLKYTFTPGEWENEVDVPWTIENITITAELNQLWSSMSLGVEPLINKKASTPQPLAYGVNVIKIKVVAQNGDELEYKINVTRHTQEYEIATLSTLAVTGVSGFSPAFDPVNAPANREFAANSTESFISVDSVAAAASDGATVQIRINDNPANNPAQIPLEGGLNTVKVICTAGNGTIETYIIRITKPIESDSVRLADLSLNGVSLTPVFNPDTSSYAVTVNAASNPFRLNAQPESSSGVVEVTLNGLVIADLSNVIFTTGVNTLDVTVTNPTYGAIPKTYSIEVTCLTPSTDATLKSLKVKMGNENRVTYQGTFQRGDPSYHVTTNTLFNKAKTDYVTVIYGYSSITVTAISTEAMPGNIQFVTTRYFGTAGATATQDVIVSQQLSGNTGTAVINLDQGYVTRIDVVSTAPDNVTQIIYSLYAKLLNADEYHWGIYAPSFDKSKASWGTPSGEVHWTGTGIVGGTWKWDTGLSSGTFEGVSYGAKSEITVTNFNDGTNDTLYNEGGFIVSGILYAYLEGAFVKDGWNVTPIRYYLRTAGGVEFVDYSYHLRVVNSVPVELAGSSYTDMKYMGAATWHRQWFKNTKPFPFTSNNWYEPWTDGQ